MGIVAKRLHLNGVKEPPKLSLPGKLIFPSMQNAGHFSMLGLGDIVCSLMCSLFSFNSWIWLQGYARIIVMFCTEIWRLQESTTELRWGWSSAAQPFQQNNLFSLLTHRIFFRYEFFISFYSTSNLTTLWFRSTDSYGFEWSVQSGTTGTSLFSSIHLTSTFDNGLH